MNSFTGDLQQAYELVSEYGEQFPERDSVPLPGVTFAHPTKGLSGVAIDREGLVAQGQIYAGDTALRAALEDEGIHSYGLLTAHHLLARHLEDDALVLGLSGYATGGYSYATEAHGIANLYNCLECRKKPGLTVDGGVSAGSLALNGIIAAGHGIVTAGFIPRQGLDSVGVRDHMIVWGDTYRDREVLVGTVPDVLVCVGGGEGTQRECQTALRCGSTVLLLALKDYGVNSLPQTYQNSQEMSQAVRDGRMIVCRSVDTIPESVGRVLEMDTLVGRPERLATVGRLLQSA